MTLAIWKRKLRPSHILAAGGIVFRESFGSVRVAVVHRARDEDGDGDAGEWMLPKGELDGGEKLSAAARREVLEETGCRATVMGPAWFSECVVDGVPEVTAIFAMEYLERVAGWEGSGASTLFWLSPGEAVERLTCDSERDVLAQAFFREERGGG